MGDIVGTPEHEWPGTLDVDELAARGWQPTPFRQFILKLHSRCNLACTYCYVYELADQTWRAQPRVMSDALVTVAALRIAEHARAHRLHDIRVIFHGGEPLLAGQDAVIDAVRNIRAAVDARVEIDFWVQTNGTLLTAELLDACEQRDIKIGVSLDGGVTSHDLNRRYPNGRGSFDVVAAGLRELMRRPSIYSGLLCVIDVGVDPIATYEAMLEFAPPVIDFLLPHGSWSAPPQGRENSAGTPYADWLITVFDRWYDATSRETGIRLFDEVVHLLLGGKSATEAVGLTPGSLVVIETDGSIEQADSLKSAYHGAAATGLHILSDSFDAALSSPHVVATQLGLAALSADCVSCSVGSICGGGLYAHRYKAGAGFRNPSVYCPDLYALIKHIRRRLVADLRLDRRPIRMRPPNRSPGQVGARR